MFKKKDKSTSSIDRVEPAGVDEFGTLSTGEKEIRRLQILLELLKGFEKAGDLESLLTRVIDSSIEVTGAERGFLMLLQKPMQVDRRLFDPLVTPAPFRKPKMEFRVARSVAKKDLSSDSFRISMTVANRVAETGIPVLIQDVQSQKTLKTTDSVTNLDLRSILCAPLRVEKEVSGIIYVDSRFVMRTFSEEDLIMFEALAEQAAIAIERSRLYEDALEKTRMEQEIKELRALDRKKSEFINMLAHEFRTPLTVIQGYSERLKSGKASSLEETASHSSIIHDESKRLSRLVDSLLDLSRMRSGSDEIDRKEADLTAIVEKAVQSLSTHSQEKEIRLTHTFGKQPIVISIDADRIYQVILNLVENAIKYSPLAGSVEVHVDEISADAVQGESYVAGFAQVSISDTGPGIQPEEREKIFEEFYRGATTSGRKESGTGLGLSICRVIVQAHGGRIWVESTPGKGSKFIFTLPIYRPMVELKP